ncbi:MAG: GNAT family N-acetyltransferase [candidate division FCPU426 bacterium]
MEPVKIRNIKASDAAFARQMLLDLGHDNDEKSLAWRISAMEGTPRERVVVAEVGDKTAGLAAASVYRYFHVDGLVCRVTVLVVHSDFRRHGIGKALVAWAETWAQEQGCDRVEITAIKERGEALEFLLRQGYQDTSRRFFKSLSGAGEKGEV